MKYIVIPIFKLIYVLLIYLLVMPFVFCIGLLFSLWHFDFSFFENYWPDNFETQNQGYVEDGEKYYYYKTGIDYLKNNKSWSVMSRSNMVYRKKE